MKINRHYYSPYSGLKSMYKNRTRTIYGTYVLLCPSSSLSHTQLSLEIANYEPIKFAKAH